MGKAGILFLTRRALFVALLALALAGCRDAERVDARDYDSFWLWAGVHAPHSLDRAKSIYLLDGELRGAPARFVPLRAAAPRTHGPEIWLVVRSDTLDWPDRAAEALVHRADNWAAAGNRVVGIQLDFDAHTHHLDDYAGFLQRFRRALPPRYRLSITGLMDWSANGDPAALAKLNGVVDEVVIQTYQGRSTIWGYERYFRRMKGFPIPFKVGLVENGRWVEPTGLRSELNFRGYVVFLLPASRSSTS